MPVFRLIGLPKGPLFDRCTKHCNGEAHHCQGSERNKFVPFALFRLDPFCGNDGLYCVLDRECARGVADNLKHAHCPRQGQANCNQHSIADPCRYTPVGQFG